MLLSALWLGLAGCQHPTPGRSATRPPSGSAAGEGGLPSLSEPKPGAPADGLRGSDPLDPFIVKILPELARSPGPVAIFPPLTGDRVTLLGERLAGRLAERLGDHGVETWHDESLRAAFHRANRGLDSLQMTSDVFWLARRIGARQAVYGTIQLMGEEVRVYFQCLDVESLNPLARLRVTLSDANSLELARRDAAIQIGSRAPPHEARLEPELEHLVSRLTLAIAEKHADAFAGHVLAVDPALVQGVGGRSGRELESLTRGFLEASKRSGGRDVPVAVSGRRYPSLDAALDAIEDRRADRMTARVGALAMKLAQTVAHTLRKSGSGSFQVEATRTSRANLVTLLKREADDQAKDPALLEDVRAQGADVLVRCSLRPFMRSHRLSVLVLDAHTGKIVDKASADLLPRFHELLKTYAEL